LREIGGVWVGSVAIECAIVGAWGNGVLREDIINTASNNVNGNGCVGPEEPVWETAILEESPCNVHVELPARITPVYEERKGKDGFGICGEISGRDEAELGVGGDRILDSLVAELCGHREVVETGTELVTEGGELKEKRMSICLWDGDVTNLVKERLIEAVVVPEKEIGWL